MERRELLKQLAGISVACGCLAATGCSWEKMRKLPKSEHSVNTYTYKQVGDCELKLDVCVGGECKRLRPIIFQIHGGALIMGGRGLSNMDIFDPLVAKGFAVVSIDYRLAPETKLPEIIKDVQDAYVWVRKYGPDLFHGDPDRIAVQGGSAGGYLTLMTGFCVKPRPRALVSYYGFGDILADWVTKPDPFYCSQPAVPKEEAMAAVGKGIPPCGGQEGNRGRFFLYCRQQGAWTNEVTGFDAHANPEAIKPFCPAMNITAEYPPTLLAHGTMDTDVPYEQSAQMAAAFKNAGIEHEFITLEGAGHGFGKRKPEDYATVVGHTTAFLLKHLV